MSDGPPPDKLLFNLTPNDDGDDPRITKAVEAAFQRIAKQKHLSVTEPGELDPAAEENPERAAKITQAAAPKLFEFTRLQKDVEFTEQRRDGKVTKRTKRIGESAMRLSISFGRLSQSSGWIGIATTVCNWGKRVWRARQYVPFFGGASSKPAEEEEAGAESK